MHLSVRYGKQVNIALAFIYILGLAYGVLSGHYSFACLIGLFAALTYTGVFLSGAVGVSGIIGMFLLNETLFMPVYMVVFLIYLIWLGLYIMAKIGELVEN